MGAGSSRDQKHLAPARSCQSPQIPARIVGARLRAMPSRTQRKSSRSSSRWPPSGLHDIAAPRSERREKLPKTDHNQSDRAWSANRGVSQRASFRAGMRKQVNPAPTARPHPSLRCSPRTTAHPYRGLKARSIMSPAISIAPPPNHPAPAPQSGIHRALVPDTTGAAAHRAPDQTPPAPIRSPPRPRDPPQV